ncbi:glutathione S-transferase 1-like [Zeugodacus cucurbitae]|uniref:Glutathione S-transferase 1 n=1 Tax=Zeugodacus cucurbitae TaxID=28588 RepID=A0A0A1WXY3_ZEUCU|nr:glutathione S-transferase 1-like [Zeugodacus cucurbitae]WBT60808.1 glutathione S-transferase [Zeugodacus cucurbitae]
MSEKIVLYGFERSPPVRAVLLTLKALNLDFEHVPVNTYLGEQKSEEYLKKNPSHTVPLLEVDGKYISDSHAIIAFLASKYGKDDSLYPKDLFQRAIVDQRLHYENGVVFQETLKQRLRPLSMCEVSQEVADEAIKAVGDVYTVLEAYLNQNKFIAADHLTIADLSLLSTVSVMNIVVPVDAGKWPKLAAWLVELKQLPYYEQANAKGLKEIEELLKPALAKYKK